MVADDGQDEIVALSEQRGADVEAGANFKTTGLELTQPEAAMRMRPAKRGGQFSQPREQLSARAWRQRGHLSGGAARLQDFHRGIRR